MLTTVAITGCSKAETKEQPRNYYGVQAENNGTPKEAYYAFFGGIVVIVFVVLYLLKKMGAKK